MKARYIILVPLIVAIVFSGYSYVVHEQTHVEIAEDYGCNATVTYINGTSFDPTTTYTCDREKMDRVSAIQDTVETSGYQIQPLYTILGYIVGLQIVFIDEVL